MRRLLALLLALTLAPPAAVAQDYATLVADSVTTQANGSVIIASGNVEVLYDGQRLLASRIVYDRNSDSLQVAGPITIIEAGGAVLTGTSARLSRDLEQGIVRGARFILEGQLQIAAVELNRVDGRYNALYKTVASSCRICPNNPVPLWRIRAEQVVHDQLERQIYFDNAVFEIMGLPVAYFPQLRMPDPTLTRATGFLIPEIRTSSNLGIGLKFPYFIVLGDHADLRLTPYISASSRTLEGRYRREFTFGSLQVDGAVSRDDLQRGDTRAYAFAEGRFKLPYGFDLNVDLRLVSDNAYLLAYDYSDADRLANTVELTRTRRDEYISLSFTKLRSLRAKEVPIEDTLATLLGRATYERRLFPATMGGELRLVFDVDGHERLANAVSPALAAACATAGALECTARDVLRAGALANWRRDWVLAYGLVGAVEGQVAADTYWIAQDPSFPGSVTRVTPSAAAELRWPLSRVTAAGATEVLEPVAQLAWTDTTGANVPNEDSRLVDFDEGNLLELSRFPGRDRYERGWRTTLGVSWTRLGPTGFDYALTAGKVFRLRDLNQFTAASGLDGTTSDWLIAGQVRRERLTLTNRSLFDESFSISKSETHLAWTGRRFAAAGSYIYVVDDPAEGRTGDTSELNFDASYAFNRHWTLSLSGSYDGNADRATRAAVGVGYTNECVNVDLSLSRRFTSSTNVAATTDFGLTVSLNGFGRDGRANTRTCHVRG